MKSKSEFNTVNSLLRSVTNSLDFRTLHNFLSTILSETPINALNHPSTLTLIKKSVLSFCQDEEPEQAKLKGDLHLESHGLSPAVDEKTRQEMSRELLDKSVEVFWKVCERKHGELEDDGWRHAFEVFHEMLNVATLFESALIDQYARRAVALLEKGESVPFVLKMLMIIISVFCRSEEGTEAGYSEINSFCCFLKFWILKISFCLMFYGYFLLLRYI